MFKRLLNYLFRYGIDASELKKVEHSVFVANRRALLMFPLISAVFFGIAAFLGYFFQIPTMEDSATAYTITSLTNVGIIFMQKVRFMKTHLLHHVLITTFLMTLYAFGIYQSIFISTNSQPLMLSVFLCVLPMFFIDFLYRLMAPTILASLTYIIFAIVLKPSGPVGIDIVDILIFSSIGVIIGAFNNKLKYERFIFENQINEFRSDEKQTKYWKSISQIYLSMTHVDLDTNLFIQVKSGYLSKINYQFKSDHFSREVVTVMKNIVEPHYIDEILDFVNTKTLRERLKGKRSITHEFRLKRIGWCRARFISVDGYSERPLRYVMFLVENINEQKKWEQKLTTMAETDEMTKLFNRRAGVPKITERLSKNVPGMFCLLDIDKFKSVNDKYGHQAGDAVIIAVASALKKTFREQDIVLRLGGDEFLAFASNVTNERTATKIFTRLFDILDEVEFNEIPGYKISVSIGATFGNENSTFESLYKQADESAYESKKIEGKALSFFKK